MSFWVGKHIVVTGGCGMIGTPLVRLLLRRGAQVTVLDDFSRGVRRLSHSNLHHIKGDAGDLATCTKALHGTDGLFNLAAHVAGVVYNQEHHSEMFSKNLLLQTMPLLAAGRLGIKRIVQVSSVCVYAPKHQCPAREEDGFKDEPHPSNWGYAMAKRIGEMTAWAMGNCVRVRPTNCYGPLDYYGERAHVIPALIQKAHEQGHELTLLGSGRERREFVYSEDVARGIMAAYHLGSVENVYNLGTNGQTVTEIASLARLIVRMVTGKEARLSFDSSKGGGESERWTDSTAAFGDLLWRFQVGLNEGLAQTIEDFKGRFVT